MRPHIEKHFHNKRSCGYQPIPPRFRRRQCMVPPDQMLDQIDTLPGRPARMPEGGYGGCETAAPWTIVVELDPDTGIVRYVIDGERCHTVGAGVEQEANRCLMESVTGLKAVAWATLGYLSLPPEERTEERDRTLAAFVREVIDHAEGRR
jgi:hypothetical protein